MVLSFQCIGSPQCFFLRVQYKEYDSQGWPRLSTACWSEAILRQNISKIKRKSNPNHYRRISQSELVVLNNLTARHSPLLQPQDRGWL